MPIHHTDDAEVDTLQPIEGIDYNTKRTARVPEVTTVTNVQRAEARLTELISQGADAASVTTAQRRLERARRQAADEARRRVEADKIRGEVNRKRARDEVAQRQRAQREAEDRLRLSDHATRIVVTHEGVRVTAWPERSADPLRRQQCAHAVAEALALFQTDTERRVGAARAAAIGKPAPEPVTRERVMTRLRDLCRHAIATGSVEVKEV